jgi:small subunit ribosomal protein S13
MVKYFDKLVSNVYSESNFGIGIKRIKLIYKNIGLNLDNLKHRNIKIKQLKYIYKNENRFIFGENLKNIKNSERIFLNEVNCYRAIRFKLGLPCNGQRSQTNARTCKRRQADPKTLQRAISFKDDIFAYNLRRRFRHSKRQVRIPKANKKDKKGNLINTKGKYAEKKQFIDIKREQKSKIIRNIWIHNKRTKKIHKQMKLKAKGAAKKNNKRR